MSVNPPVAAENATIAVAGNVTATSTYPTPSTDTVNRPPTTRNTTACAPVPRNSGTVPTAANDPKTLDTNRNEFPDRSPSF